MCAMFHPKEDLVVSASLDRTVRIWDIRALRKKLVSPADFFGETDAILKFILEGHDRGVNWASFHPTLPLVVSGADDHQVKIWQINDTKAWAIDTLRGHKHNVSCVLFYRHDIIISDSEDKCIHVWDATKRTHLQTFRREHDRFWIIGCHPEINLLAAGHDSGMVVFKLERERPAFTVSGDYLYFVKDHFLCYYDYSTRKESQVIPIRRPGSVSLNQGARTLSYSPTENAALICSDVDGGSYELYIVPKSIIIRTLTVQEPKRGGGGSAVFVARNRFAVLEKSTNQVLVKNLENELVKKTGALPIATDAIFYAGTGNLLCRAEDRVFIFDLQQRMKLGELQTNFIRYVVWSNDMESVALLSKHCIIIADNKLVHRCTLHETVHVKSGSWDDNGIFIYTTLTHIKYCLPNGDSGIIKTLDLPLYITKIFRNTIFCLDRDGKNCPISVDSTEYIFKLSLLNKRYDHVMTMISNSELCGQAMIAYLQQKGYPEVALHLVKDERTRFNLALESGNIQIAVASAKEIDEKDHWYRLGVESLRHGNTGIVEYAYQRTKNFERLSFLYLITGNLDKLSKMMKIAKVKKDVMGQFQNALYLGDVKERVKILENADHIPLAYVTAKTHGLNDVAEALADKLQDNVPSFPSSSSASLLMPPTPVMCGGDWPLLRVMKGIFEGGLDNVRAAAQEEYEDAADAAWAEDVDIVDMETIQNGDIRMVIEDEEAHEDYEEGGWDLDDLELPPDVDTPKTNIASRSSVFVAPTAGMPVSKIWVQRSSFAAEHAAAGNFDTAMRLLNRQLGIRNFAPLKSRFIDLHMGSHSYLRAFTSSPVISMAIERGWSESADPNVRAPPALLFSFSQLEGKLEAGYKATSLGRINEALRQFVGILHTIPVIVVESQREVDEVKELIITVKEYVLGLQMELRRRKLNDNPIRQQELAAYFTHCNLMLPHLRLTLNNAMVLCYKGGNLITASNFARRLLEANPTLEAQSQKARSVIQAAERNMNDSTQLNYDFRNPFFVCGATHVPIYHRQKDVLCPYCHTHYVLSQEGQLCTVCELAVVGSDASGLLCSPSQIR